MLKHLRWQLTLLCELICGTILFVMSFSSLHVSENHLKQNSLTAFQSNINTIVYRLQGDHVIGWSWLSQTEASDRLIIHIEDNGHSLQYSGSWQPLTARGELVEKTRTIALEDYHLDADIKPVSELNADSAIFSLTGAQGERYQAAVVVVPTPPGYKSVVILKDMRNEEAIIAQQRMIFLSLSLGGVALLAIFSWWLAGRAIKPIAVSRQKNSEFIASASHELRSPLAVIRASAAALHYEYNAENNPQATRFINAIERECVRSARLVDDLLLLANSDASNLSMSATSVDPETLLIETRENFLPLADEKNIKISLMLPDATLPSIQGDAQRLAQALSIVLDNALRYAPLGSAVTLTAKKTAQHLRLFVIDCGPGIPAQYKSSVFDRFYQMDSARTSKENYGLGLSIAQEILRLHRGKIHLRDTKGGGLTVVLDLPLPGRRSFI